MKKSRSLFEDNYCKKAKENDNVVEKRKGIKDSLILRDNITCYRMCTAKNDLLERKQLMMQGRDKYPEEPNSWVGKW